MVILEAKVTINNVYKLSTSYLNPCQRLAVSFDGKSVCDTLVETKNGCNFYFDKEAEVIISIPIGEWNIEFLYPQRKIDLYCGRKVGTGIIVRVNEIYVECETFKLINDKKRCREIVAKAETMDNALVYEDVYSLLETM